MVHAKDLRIGNILLKEGIRIIADGRTIMVIEWSEDVAARYEPIPLTEEWLLKFGFARCLSGLYTCYYFDSGGDFSGEFVVRFYKDDIDVAPFAKKDVSGGDTFNSIAIQYVHQLQNFYYILTGEELTIKS